MELVETLKQKSDEIDAVLNQILSIPFEDESSDELVSTLQRLVNERQKLLSKLLSSEKNAAVLKAQHDVGKRLEKKASEIRLQRKNLILAKSRNKRQLNVYKSVDSNR